MTTIATNRKQRLQTLENQIRKAAESIQTTGVEIGLWLVEIREHELWKEEYDSWNQYLIDMAEELVGKSFSQAARLIQAAEVSKRLPSRIDATTLGPTHFQELARLAPNTGNESGVGGVQKDYFRLRKQDVARVIESAIKLGGTDTPSVRDLRKAVDADLGIDRAAKARETKAKDNGIDLADYIDRHIGTIEGVLDSLKEIETEAWVRFASDKPQLLKRLSTACEALATFLRKGK